MFEFQFDDVPKPVTSVTQYNDRLQGQLTFSYGSFSVKKRQHGNGHYFHYSSTENFGLANSFPCYSTFQKHSPCHHILVIVTSLCRIKHIYNTYDQRHIL
jgi:hypothetical protein